MLLTLVMIKIFTSIFVILFLSLNIKAQYNENAPWIQNQQKASTASKSTFQDLSKSFNDYFKDKDWEAKGSGFKPFKRWEDHWKYYTLKDGSIAPPSMLWQSWEHKNAIANKSDNLSNWYVRLNRKRFWGQDYDTDKISAYQTLYTCLETVAKLMSPIAPFYSDSLYSDLNSVSKRDSNSVHISEFPKYQETIIAKNLEERMELAQQISSMSLSLRRKSKIKVRQPLQKIMIPALNNGFQSKVDAVKDIILTEINVKEIEYLKDSSGIIVKNLKPDFRIMGKKYGKLVKNIANELFVGAFSDALSSRM